MKTNIYKRIGRKQVERHTTEKRYSVESIYETDLSVRATVPKTNTWLYINDSKKICRKLGLYVCTLCVYNISNK